MLSRRSLLKVGLSGTASALMQAAMLQSSRAAGPSSGGKARAKAVIYLHQWGGASQFETFDMKPNAPAEIRGSFKPIRTKVPGIQVCEALPGMAEVADKVCILRGLQHSMKNHAPAGYYSLSGFPPPIDDQRLRDSLDLFPAFGSVVDKFAPSKLGTPTFVSYPYVTRDGSVTGGQHASFLGKLHNPLFFTQDPNSPSFQLPELSLPSEISLQRLENRREVLRLIDEQTDLLEKSALAHGIDEVYRKAVAMLTSPDFRRAFDLSQEKKELRDRYGRTTYGQGCLLARRLVEAGAKWINVYLSESIGGDTGGWDVHGFNNKPMDPILKNHLLPITDRTLPTLIRDLSERGMLDDVVVLWMGEFGRTPRINKLAGRDHWPQCYTILMAGGGIKPGTVVGASDRIGAYPAQDIYRIEDVSATMYHLLGLDPETEMVDKLGRPIPISKGKIIRDVLA